VVSLSRNRDRTRAPHLYREDPIDVIPIGDVQSRFYLRMMVQDKPGVLSRITRILGNCNISIDSVLQIGRSEEELVPVILTTHRASGEEMRAAVDKIESLDDVGKQPICLHIEENLETN
jgi:homoserine dehydrogenase